jgi:hypothetical protein
MNQYNICIFDNLLNETELDYVKSWVFNSYLKYGHSSIGTERIATTFFSITITDNFFINDIKQKIEQITKKQFLLNRCYMHIQTCGLDGGYHIDTEYDNCYTFCIYISNLTNTEIEENNGEFFIKIPNKIFIISIDTYMNRGILFPANYFHKGMAYNRIIQNNDGRVCITWKLQEI